MMAMMVIMSAVYQTMLLLKKNQIYALGHDGDHYHHHPYRILITCLSIDQQSMSPRTLRHMYILHTQNIPRCMCVCTCRVSGCT